ncbi:MAG: hypothetical protein WA776_10065 [Xanthobacteraceae bacterium]
MDILAAMFAYIGCLAGIVAGLVMSFVVFFSAPGEFSRPPAQAIAMVARQPSQAAAAPVSAVKTVAKADRSSKQIAAASATPAAVPPVAFDAQQKPLISQAHLHRIAQKQRARQLAYREHSSFESRFLHFDD